MLENIVKNIQTILFISCKQICAKYLLLSKRNTSWQHGTASHSDSWVNKTHSWFLCIFSPTFKDFMATIDYFRCSGLLWLWYLQIITRSILCIAQKLLVLKNIKCWNTAHFVRKWAHISIARHFLVRLLMCWMADAFWLAKISLHDLMIKLTTKVNVCSSRQGQFHYGNRPALIVLPKAIYTIIMMMMMVMKWISDSST